MSKEAQRWYGWCGVLWWFLQSSAVGLSPSPCLILVLSNLLLVKLCAEATTTAAEQTTTVVASVDGAKAEWQG
jgi:uncharacterized protein YabE (DUF348 family)